MPGIERGVAGTEPLRGVNVDPPRVLGARPIVPGLPVAGRLRGVLPTLGGS